MTEQINETINTTTNKTINKDISTSTALSGTSVSNIPDKFKVTLEDGSLDYKSTLDKMNESYNYLEKKVRIW